MKKYILEYSTHDEALALLGHEIPHTHLENVKTIIIDLHEDEYLAIKEAGYKITENQEIQLLAVAENLPATRSMPTYPSYINTYFKIDQAHLAGLTGTGVKVAFLDTGCNAGGVDICDNLIRVDLGYGVDDGANHGGKLCAIVAQIRSAFDAGLTVNEGMAYGATTYSYRVYEGGAAGIIVGISDCIANGVNIINISLDAGAGCNSAIASGIAAGIIFVCASGNNLSYMAHPANVEGVIAVNTVSYASATIPAGNYLTTDGHTGVTIVNYREGFYEHLVAGTSQAAAHTTGLLALYKQKYPSLNQAKAINLLKRRALKMTGQTYNLPSVTTAGVLENYQTGAGFVAPLY